MNTYHCFFRHKRIEVEAETSRKAQIKAAEILKTNKGYEITVVLVAKDGEPVTHLPLM
jgi:hypothetical protein